MPLAELVELNKNIRSVVVTKTCASGGIPLIRIHVVLKRLVSVRGLLRESLVPGVDGIANHPGSLMNKIGVIYYRLISILLCFHVKNRGSLVKAEINCNSRMWTGVSEGAMYYLSVAYRYVTRLTY